MGCIVWVVFLVINPTIAMDFVARLFKKKPELNNQLSVYGDFQCQPIAHTVIHFYIKNEVDPMIDDMLLEEDEEQQNKKCVILHTSLIGLLRLNKTFNTIVKHTLSSYAEQILARVVDGNDLIGAYLNGELIAKTLCLPGMYVYFQQAVSYQVNTLFYKCLNEHYRHIKTKPSQRHYHGAKALIDMLSAEERHDFFWYELATEGNAKISELLLQAGVAVNEQVAHDQFKNTPLHYVLQNHSVSENKLAMVKILVNHGVDLNAQNTYGQTALDAARGIAQLYDFKVKFAFQGRGRNLASEAKNESRINHAIVDALKKKDTKRTCIIS